MENNSIYHSLADFKKGMGELSEQLPDVVNAYHKFTETCFAE